MREDLRYILDPTDVMGPDYPSETFRVLQKNEIAKFGEYRTQRLVLAAWDRQAAGLTPLSEVRDMPVELPVSQVPNPPKYEDLPDGSWTIHRVEPYIPAVPAARLLAAIVAEFLQPTPQDEIGLIYYYASKPEKLTPMLQGEERATWVRLVGSDAQPPSTKTLQTPVRSDLPFAEAVTWLRSRNALSENLDQRTWQRGISDSGLPLTGWPEGRARFVSAILKSVGYQALRSNVAHDDAVYRLPREPDGAWLRFGSTTAPGDIFIAYSPSGPWLLSVQHTGVAREFGPSMHPGPRAATQALTTLAELHRAIARTYQLSVSLPQLPLQSFREQTAGLPRDT